MDELLRIVLDGPVFDWLNGLFQSELGKFAIVFLLATHIHKKEVKKQFALLRASIDHLTEVMGRRFDEHDMRIRSVEAKVMEREPGP